MLEKYIPDFDEDRYIEQIQKDAAVRNNTITKREALSLVLKSEPKENYYQKKIMDAIHKRWPEAYVIKIAQGAYSTAGVPDIMVVLHGRYYGIEVKRPVGGKLSKLQELSILRIGRAGGVAGVCHWPEEAIDMIERNEG